MSEACEPLLIMIFIEANSFRLLLSVFHWKYHLKEIGKKNRFLIIIHFNYRVTRIIIKWTLSFSRNDIFAPFFLLIFHRYLYVLLFLYFIRIPPSPMPMALDIGCRRQKISYAAPEMLYICLEMRGCSWEWNCVCTLLCGIFIYTFAFKYIIESYNFTHIQIE